MTFRGAAIVVDASNPWPALAPEGFLGNLVLQAPVSVQSDGSSEDSPDAATSLQSALARTIAAIRGTINYVREPANLANAMSMRFEGMLDSANHSAFLEGIKAAGFDALFTNWNQAGHETMDFGEGPATSLIGHFGVQRAKMVGIAALNKDAVGVRMPLESVEAWLRLRSSPVLPALAPVSGLLEEFIESHLP